MGRKGNIVRCNRCGLAAPRKNPFFDWFKHECKPGSKLVVPTKKEKERMTSDEMEEYERKLKAEVTRGKVLSKMVGGAQVTTYKTPGSNLIYAAKKKPRP